jgi:hypothetical protein
MWFEPAEELRGDGITLRRYRRDDLEALKEAIATTHEHLRAWMPRVGEGALEIGCRMDLRHAGRDPRDPGPLPTDPPGG